MGVRTISKTIDLSQLPKESKYITKINDTGITIHPEVWTNQSSYIQLDGTGMELFNSSGISIAKYGEDIRLGNENEGKLLITAGGQGHTYEDAGTYIIDGNDNILAQFLASGAQIGSADGAHSVIDTDGQRFYARDGTTQLANIGYGRGASQSGVAIAPYYTFGIRHVDDFPANYSMAEGVNIKAIGYASHAEGNATESHGTFSHAEGAGTKAIGAGSHAEGVSSYAGGDYSHAEGSSSSFYSYSHAEGNRSMAQAESAHAQNEGTYAKKRAQTTLGTYNEEDTSSTTTHPSGTSSYGQYAVIVGNGTADDARSNALTVDWDGNIEAAGQVYQTVEQITPSITTNVGALSSATLTRCGNLRQLTFTISNSTAIAVGSNVYTGTLTNAADRPITNITGVSYYTSSCLCISITSAGGITVRVTGAQLAANSSPTIGILYIAS